MSAERLTARLVRQHQIIANLHVEPQPFWTQVLRNIWSRTFYLAPFAFPLLIVSALWILRPQEMDFRVYILSWAFGVPLGFLLWVFAWKTYGAGTGQVTMTVGATAIVGWCVWSRGVYLTLVDQKLRSGTALCLASMLALFFAKATIVTGIGPLKLAIAAGLTGVAIPLTLAFALQVIKLQRFAVRKFGPPIWKFLTQPVKFPKWPTANKSDEAGVASG